MTPAIESGSLRIPHQPHFNFEPNDDFTITFYYDLGGKDNDYLSVSNQNRTYTILSKEGTQIVPPHPSETTQHTSLSTTGSLDLKAVYAGPQYPYKIYIAQDQNSSALNSIFFERSDGENTQVVSSSFLSYKANNPPTRS